MALARPSAVTAYGQRSPPPSTVQPLRSTPPSVLYFCTPMTCPTPLHLIIKSGGSAAIPEWTSLFAALAPQVVVHDWEKPPADPSVVDFALVWEPEAGGLARFPQLKAILSSAAGVEHILADPLLPTHLPVVRMVTVESQQRMAEFCLMATLMLQKNLARALAQSRRHS